MKKKLFLLSTLVIVSINMLAQTANKDHYLGYDNQHLLCQNNSSEERLEYISLTVGYNGEWAFIFYPNGNFSSREWYGYNGRYDTRYMKDITTSNGTYYITRVNGHRRVYFKFKNGKEKTGTLTYDGNGAKLTYNNYVLREIQ